MSMLEWETDFPHDMTTRLKAESCVDATTAEAFRRRWAKWGRSRDMKETCTRAYEQADLSHLTDKQHAYQHGDGLR